jgi:AraC family transcriptional regulator
VSPDIPVFGVRDTHGRVLRPANRVLLDSQTSGWRTMHAAVFEEAPLDALEQPAGNPSFIYHVARPTRVARRIVGSRREQAVIGPRQICITPGQSTAQWEHVGRPEILQVYVRRSVYERTVQELHGVDGTGADPVPRFAIRDPFLEQLALAVLEALRDGGSAGGLYVDTLAQMIAVHFARTSRPARKPSVRAGVGLAQPRLRRLVDYIEDHLAADVSLETLASVAGVSPVYLARLFKKALGHPPHRYVVLRRLERAKALLRESDNPIVDVALASGFSSQSHLSSWFMRLIGVSPAAYRDQR